MLSNENGRMTFSLMCLGMSAILLGGGSDAWTVRTVAGWALLLLSLALPMYSRICNR
jgi:hypothetical protein